MLKTILTLNPLVFHSLIIIASLIVLAKSAHYIVLGISNYARKIGVSDYLIGLLVISVGTAVPELVASITGATIGQGGIVFGTILGSSLFKIPLLGLVLLIARRVTIDREVKTNPPILSFVGTMLPLALILDGVLSRGDGILLLLVFLWYCYRIWTAEKKFGKLKKNVPFRIIWKDALIFLISLAALLLSARWLVFSSMVMSDYFDISPFLVGLIVIGIGASAPELLVQITSIRKKHNDIAFGNAVGSLVANSAFALGIAPLVKPIAIDPSSLLSTGIFFFLGTVAVIYLMERKEVNWKHGLWLIILYTAFLAFELIWG